MAKILLWDIESTGLKGDFATILCIGWKWYGEGKVNVISITDYPEKFQADPTNDGPLIKDFMKVYAEADMTITYFGVGFDRKMFYTKLLEHKLPLPANIPMVDLFFTVKSNTALSRKSLDNVANFLGTSTQKTRVDGKIWKRAMAGHKPSIRYIIDHCEKDVIVLEEVYERLRPLVRTHPRVAELAACRYCGSNRLVRRGFVLTVLRGRYQRIVCRDCGGWDQVRVKG